MKSSFCWKLVLQFGFIQRSSKFSNLKPKEEKKLYSLDAHNLNEGKWNLQLWLLGCSFQQWFIFCYPFKNFVFLFLTLLGLCCCPWAFSRCSMWGLLLWSTGSRTCRLQHFPCMGLVGPQNVGSSWTRIKPMSPMLAGSFLPLSHQRSLSSDFFTSF